MLDKSILAKLNNDAVMATLEELHILPDEISKAADNMNAFEHLKLEIQMVLNTAMLNLEAAEATAISFPDAGRQLSNEGQRKAYVIEKTATERRIVVEQKNKLLWNESNSLDAWRGFKRLTNKFDAAKHKAELMAAVLRYLDNGQE